jgi:hypothetical protein
VTYGAQVSQRYAYIYPILNGVFVHLILGCGLPICHQNRAKAQTKDAAIWAWEPLTAKSKKGWPQPVEQRTKKRWIALGKPIQDARKEGNRKDKEIYQEVVRLP